MLDLPGNLRSPQGLSAKRLQPLLSNGALLSPGTFWQIQQEISRTCFVLEAKNGVASLNLTLKDDAPINHLAQKMNNWIEKTITFEVSQNTHTIIDQGQAAQELAMNGTDGCSGEDLCLNGTVEKKMLLTEISWQSDGLFKTTTLEISDASIIPALNTKLESMQNSSMVLNAEGHYQIL